MRVAGTLPGQRVEAVYEARTPYQQLVLGRLRGSRCLVLDDELQYVEGPACDAYHQALGPGALRYLTRLPGLSGAILGGGDGILVAHLLRARPDARLTVFELDPVVVRTFETHPEALAMNGGSLAWVDRVVLGDALRTLHGRYDVVFMDFPDQSLRTAYLYGDAMFARVHGALLPGGLLSAYAGGGRAPEVVDRYFQRLGHHVVPGFEGGSALILYARRREGGP